MAKRKTAKTKVEREEDVTPFLGTETSEPDIKDIKAGLGIKEEMSDIGEHPSHPIPTKEEVKTLLGTTVTKEEIAAHEERQEPQVGDDFESDDLVAPLPEVEETETEPFVVEAEVEDKKASGQSKRNVKGSGGAGRNGMRVAGYGGVTKKAKTVGNQGARASADSEDEVVKRRGVFIPNKNKNSGLSTAKQTTIRDSEGSKSIRAGNKV
jgi:hypothetical protein